jgi:hypothetical protein
MNLINQTIVITKILLLVILLSTISSCQKKDLTKDIGEVLTLCFGEKGYIADNGNNTEISFIDLVEDSTCPEGARSQTILLGFGDLLTQANPPVSNAKDFGNYKITLLDAGYGRKANKGVEKRYYVKIRVDKK